MYLNIAEMTTKATPEIKEVELFTVPGVKIRVKKLSIAEYLATQDDVRKLLKRLEEQDEKANEGKKEDDPTRVSSNLRMPNATRLAAALLKETGVERYYQGKDIFEVYDELQKMPVDTYAEIVTAVDELNPTTTEEITRSRNRFLEEKKKQLENATKSEKSTV